MEMKTAIKPRQHHVKGTKPGFECLHLDRNSWQKTPGLFSFKIFFIELCDEQNTSYSETFIMTTSRKFHSIYMWKKPHITTQLFSCFPQTIDFGSLPKALLHLISKIRNTGQTSRISCFAWVLFICSLSFLIIWPGWWHNHFQTEYKLHSSRQRENGSNILKARCRNTGLWMLKVL